MKKLSSQRGGMKSEMRVWRRGGGVPKGKAAHTDYQQPCTPMTSVNSIPLYHSLVHHGTSKVDRCVGAKLCLSGNAQQPWFNRLMNTLNQQHILGLHHHAYHVMHVTHNAMIGDRTRGIESG